MAQEDFWKYMEDQLRNYQEPIMSGAKVTHDYLSSPFSHPVMQVLAGGGTPGQMEAGMAQTRLPNLRSTDFLQRLIQAGMRVGDNSAAGLGDSMKFWLDQDYRNLPRADTHTAGSQMAAGIYDRLMFPGVIQQMEQDPDFGPAIRQIMGRDRGYAEPG